MNENEISRIVLDCSYKVHTELGPGLYEHIYKECLYYEMNLAGISVVKEHPLPVIYKNINLELGYRADLYIENKVIVEIKTVEAFNEAHLAQVLTYLRLSGSRLGMLLNFNVAHMKNGIKRVVNNLFIP